MQFEAVIFDCDGVLVDSEVLAIRGERSVLDAMGLNYTPEDYVRKFVGLHDAAFFDMLRADYREVLGVDAPDDFDERVLEGRRRERASLTVVTGAAEALTTARRVYDSIGVASSSRAHFLKSKLERTGLFDLAAPHIYSADLVENGKPSPDIFLYTAEKIGVTPDKCLVIEDSENGVKAGLAAKMTVWGFLGGGHCYDGHGGRLRDAGADRSLTDFGELVRLFSGA